MTTPFRLDTSFYQIPGAHSEATFGAIMEILLKTRLKMHLETNPNLYEEDVNTYLAGLMVSYFDPTYLQAISTVVSDYDMDVYQAVSKSEDRYHMYWIYKVNADDLLLSLGIFHRVKFSPQGEVIRAKRYYSCASEYQRRIYGKSTAVAEIQTKLAGWTERYLALLTEARGDYLHFVEQLKPDHLAAMSEHLQQMEKELPMKSKRDELLDAYSLWKAGRQTEEQRQRLLQLTQELKNLDLTFDSEDFLRRL